MTPHPGVARPEAAHPDAARQTVADRRALGAALRKAAPRSGQADWTPAHHRQDPVAILQAQGAGRIAALLPVRYARMQASAFAFLRGGAAIMAADLAGTAAAGLRVQACGDCHLANFGAYGSPEGLPLFDVNDFDETLPAPFEWDLKRLATSLVLAGQGHKLPEGACRDLAFTVAHAYARAMDTLAALDPVAAWSRQVDLVAAIASMAKERLRAQEERRLRAALQGSKAGYGLAVRDHGSWRIRDKPPQVHHLGQHEHQARMLFTGYGATLSPERRALLARYKLRDVAFKVVGIGSVGTFCAIGLFADGEGHPLLLQLKQAQDSVLAPFAGPGAYEHQGERVVMGQRMLQAASDVFLGWTHLPGDGRHFYVRALKDQRMAAVGATLEGTLGFYADLCGRTLARAHARSGDAAAIAGYMGAGPGFARAVAGFAAAYARQTAEDWEVFRAAIAAGVIEAHEP